MTVQTGSAMEDTFVTDMLPKSHPFVHKDILACPDHGSNATIRERVKNPSVKLVQFSKCMNRRIEHQIRSSWSYNNTLWNMNFRDQLNRSRMIYAVAPRGSASSESIEITPEAI